MTSRAATPSYLTLPERSPPYPALLDYLDGRYPKVGRAIWERRLSSGLITEEDGRPVTLATVYRPRLRLRYFREVPDETPVPFVEDILFADEHILVADKPHFLPVIPAGPYVNECLLYRLRQRTGNPDLVPVNRLDRETAGLVLFSVNPATRGRYGMLFQRRRVHKLYEAIGRLPSAGGHEWYVETRIEKGEPWFRSRNTEGDPNARSWIWLLDRAGDYGYFLVSPITGQNHQVRLHLCAIGSGVLNDALYPELWPAPKPGFENPLQLISRSLEFEDPLTGERHYFASRYALQWPPASATAGAAMLGPKV